MFESYYGTIEKIPKLDGESQEEYYKRIVETYRPDDDNVWENYEDKIVYSGFLLIVDGIVYKITYRELDDEFTVICGNQFVTRFYDGLNTITTMLAESLRKGEWNE